MVLVDNYDSFTYNLSQVRLWLNDLNHLDCPVMSCFYSI